MATIKVKPNDAPGTPKSPPSPKSPKSPNKSSAKISPVRPSRTSIKLIGQSVSSMKEKFLSVAQAALYFGAAMSIFDLLCDMAMIREFRRTGQSSSANATIACVLISMTFQLVAVYVQNMKLRKRVILRELFFVVFCIKPGIDAYRVATKQPQIPGTKFTPHTEMVFVRGAELVTECIPGTIIQALAFISGEQSLIAAVSLISGILTSAFISASISIEKDISKAPRYETPNFYGIVPLESWWRTITTCLLILLMATVQLAAKAFAFAICNVESSSILAAYLVIDYSVALIFKLVRGDFTYWVSIESISIRMAVALLLRIGMKAIMDFTGMLQARHPSEYGGGYFSFTLLTTPIVGMYFGSRYLNYVEDEQVRESLTHVFTSAQVYGLLGGLSALQIFSFCLLLRIIPAKFRITFLGFQTAPQFYSKRFHAFTEDSKRVAVFTCQKEMYLPVLDDVKKWLNERLPEWIVEEPFWFDDRIKATIPGELVEDQELMKKIRNQLES